MPAKLEVRVQAEDLLPWQELKSWCPAAVTAAQYKTKHSTTKKRQGTKGADGFGGGPIPAELSQTDQLP